MHAFVAGLRRSKDFLETRLLRGREVRFLAGLLVPCCLVLAWCLYKFAWTWFLGGCTLPLLFWHLWVRHPQTIPVPRVARLVDSEYRLRDLMASAQEFQLHEAQNPLVSGLLMNANEETKRFTFPDEYKRQRVISRILWALFVALIIANLLAMLPWPRVLSSRESGNTSTGGSENTSQDISSSEDQQSGDGEGTSGQEGKSGSEGRNGQGKSAGSGKSGTDGKDGRDGKGGGEGKSGTDGKNGGKGEDGKDGKSGKEGQGSSPQAGQNKGQGKSTGNAENSGSGNRESEKALNSFGRGLQQNPATEALGKALTNGDYRSAAREAEKMSQNQSSNGADGSQQAKGVAQAAKKALEGEGKKADQGTQQLLKQLAASGASEARSKEAMRQLAQTLKGLADQKQSGDTSGQPKRNGQGAGGTKAGGELDEDPLKRMNQKRPFQPGDDRLVDPNERKRIMASASQRLGAFEGTPELTPEQLKTKQLAAERAAQSRKVDEFAQRHRIPDEFRTYLKEFFTR